MIIEIGKLTVSIILMALGLLFFFNNKNIGKGASKFYKIIYTEKNLKIMFKVLGIILIILAIILIFK